MSKNAERSFYFAGVPLVATGSAFAAVWASGQEAFGWSALGLLVPGVSLLIAGLVSRARAQA